jgi:hypothetical protein
MDLRDHDKSEDSYNTSKDDHDTGDINDEYINDEDFTNDESHTSDESYTSDISNNDESYINNDDDIKDISDNDINDEISTPPKPSLFLSSILLSSLSSLTISSPI